MSAAPGRSVARNAAAALVFQLLLVAVNLAATAVLVRTLGTGRFGGWTLLGVTLAYGSLLDLGLGTSLVRRAAAAHGAGDLAGLSAAVGATLFATAALGVLGAAVIMASAEFLGRVLHVPEAWRPEFVSAMRITAVAIGLAVPGAALGAVPTALQRLDRLLAVEAVATIVTVLVQIVVALRGAGLVPLAAIGTAGRLLSLLLRAWLVGNVAPGLRLTFDLRYPFWSELGRFGALKVVQQLASQVVLQVDRVLVALLVSAPAVALYAVPLELAQKLLFVPNFVGMAYYPAAASLAHDRDGFRRLYWRTNGWVALATVPAAALLALLAAPLLGVFAGAEYATGSAATLRVLAPAYAGMALTAIPSLTADARNRPDIPARFSLIAVVLNLSLSLLLIPRFGVLGAALALMGNVLLLTPWFIVSVSKRVVE